LSLSEATRRRTATLDAGIYACFAAHVRSFLPFDQFSLGRVERTGMTVVACTEDADHNVFFPGQSFPMQETLVRSLEANAGCLIRADLAVLPDDALSGDERAARDAGLRAAAMLPLIVAGELVGVLNFWSKESHAFTQEQVTPVVLLAPLITAALHNVRTQTGVAGPSWRREDESPPTPAWLYRAFQAIRGGVLLLDGAGCVLDLNDAGAEILGQPANALIGSPLHGAPFQLTQLDGAPFVLDEQTALAATPWTRSFRRLSLRIVRLDGSERLIELDVVPQADAGGVVRQVVLSLIDVTAYGQAEQALMMSEERFRTMLEMSPVGACIISEAGIFESVNSAICALYGYTAEELVGQPITMLFAEEARVLRLEAFRDRLAAGEQGQLEMDLVTKSGRLITVLSSAVQFTSDDGRTHRAAFVFDITERKEFEDQLNHAAHHDALTGLPNRVLYNDRLQQALLLARRHGQALSILMIDLNGFKQVNDTRGHEIGDCLLQEVAKRLLAIMRAGDTVARLGGDEFAVVLPQADEAGATRVANKIRAALAPPIALRGRETYIGGSVGIAVLGEHADDVETLQRAADLAMYVAKAAGGGFAVYAPEHGAERRALKERRPSSVAAELRQAITRSDLRLYYQPLVSCIDGRIRRVEALVRWEHPEKGLLPPDYFINAAEQSDAITPLTIWVLEEALRQCRAWHEDGLILGVAVNVSLRTLRESQFPDLVSALLRQYRVAPADLTLEITENSVLEEQELTLRVLHEIAALGVRIALDDVGIGHSSLEYITQLPVNELKVDRSFLSAAPGSKGHAVVCCILGLGAALDLSVVVEGVETREAWDWLIGLGCEWAQGYFMSRPLPPEALEEWYRAHAAPG
jgi:diguanylate cyclase (GGDEF)-like protein/PAS domain S-box-containing protein